MTTPPNLPRSSFSDATRFVVRDAGGTELDPVVPESLRPYLVARAGTDGGPVRLTGIRAGDQETRTAVATPADDGSWSVETARDRTAITARAPNTDAVFDLLRSWAADDDWWLEAFHWRDADRPDA